ncbi:MAG: twin-arginine translocase TatA/TatE family subunit [Pseudobdellovibrio sp.]
MLILAIIALVVIPPEKLPDVAKQLARMYRDFKRSTAGMWDDLKEEAMQKPEVKKQSDVKETKPHE